MINVDAEVSRFKNCKDRDELVRQIKHYKDLALQSAANLASAGQYTSVAHKLQEMCDKLPAPTLIRHPSGSGHNAPQKTADITDEEHAKIKAAWEKKAKK